VFAFADCELDPECHELRRRGSLVHVEPQVFAVLLLLVRHRDRVVGHGEMLDSIWGDRCVTASAVTSRVKAARRAIGDDGGHQCLIRTVRGIGYRFVAATNERVDGSETEVLPQDIRFCRGEDGLRIALATSGSGPVLVKAANWMTHLAFDTGSPFWRPWLAGLSRNRTLVRYDPRGCGLSSWEVASLGFEQWVHDLELVVDSLELRRFPLIGLSHGGAVAVGYASRHPERVSHLVLIGACARGATALAAASLERWPPLDELPRRTTSPANSARFHEALIDVDVRDAATAVTCPTLLLHSREDRVVPLGCAAELACAIPLSRLVPLPGDSHLPRQHEAAWPVLLAEVRAFLDRGPSEPPRHDDVDAPPSSVPRRLARASGASAGAGPWTGARQDAKGPL
jgi:pimeloyl-ACP methyl ester carboxylesterase/DNA-binding winged helix-turn-helix (wHTH) protein